MALTKGDLITVAGYSGTCTTCQSPVSAWVLLLQYIGPAEIPGAKEFFILRPLQCPGCFTMINHLVLCNADPLDHMPWQYAKWN